MKLYGLIYGFGFAGKYSSWNRGELSPPTKEARTTLCNMIEGESCYCVVEINTETEECTVFTDRDKLEEAINEALRN